MSKILKYTSWGNSFKLSSNYMYVHETLLVYYQPEGKLHLSFKSQESKSRSSEQQKISATEKGKLATINEGFSLHCFEWKKGEK